MRIQIVSSPPFITEEEIERRAMQLLANYARKEGERVEKPPVDVHRIAEFYLELNLLYEEIDQNDGDPILALINPYEKTICLNTRHRHLFDDVIGPETFTIAHEIGHWELHIIKNGWGQLPLPMGDPPPSQDTRYICRSNQSDRREIQANKFAAALLMPRYLVKDAISGKDLSRYETVTSLAKLFNVSKQALIIRLKDLECIDDSNGTLRGRKNPQDVLF